jgi:heat shock protein HslJ
MNKRGSWGLVLLLMLAGALAACSEADVTATSASSEPGAQPTSEPTTQPEPAGSGESTLYVGPVLVDCEGEGPQKCYLVKETPDAEYEMFYDQIEGFTFEPGFEYELRVKTEAVENPPAGGSSIKWTLVEVVDKSVSLAGRRWKVEAYVAGEGVLVDVLPDTSISIEFQYDGFSGNAGCNNYFGSYEAADNSISVGPVGMTEMFCGAPGVMDQESAYLAALQSAASYQIVDNQLEMTNADGMTVLQYAMEEPTALTGTRWQLTYYNNGRGGFTSALLDTELTAEFNEDGQMSGSAGCNSYSGSYQIDGNNISIGPLASTMMMCETPEGVMDQETEYLAALERAATYEIIGNQLEMKDVDGSRIASYIALPPATLAGTSWTVTAYNNGQDAVVSVIIGTEITAEFDQDGSLAGSAGCNNYNTTYEVDGENITIGPAATTRMMCGKPEGIMDQENQYLAALQSAATFRMQGDKLELRTADGALAVAFARATQAMGIPELTAVLRNMTYNIDVTQSGTASLTDGEYREQAAPGSATETVVSLTDFESYGTLSNGEQAAAVLLTADPGGSGTFFYLSIVVEGDGEPVNTATILLGDRVQVNSLDIADGNIVVDMITHGPDDPMCCPTQHVVQTYELQDAGLVLTSTDVLGSADSGGSAAGGPNIIGVLWRWKGLSGATGVSEVGNPDSYTVEFMPDGNVAVKADCNQAGGTYMLTGNTISIEILTMTMAACPPDSRSDEFIEHLNAAASYFVKEGSLFIELEDDGGMMEFVR